MKHTPILKNTTRSIFFAGVMVFGMAGIVHAQNLGGPGQIGGMGQGGAPAGQFPSDRVHSKVGSDGRRAMSIRADRELRSNHRRC